MCGIGLTVIGSMCNSGLFWPWYMCTMAPQYTCTAAEIGCGIVYLGQRRPRYSVLRHRCTHYMCYIYVYRGTAVHIYCGQKRLLLHMLPMTVN